MLKNKRKKKKQRLVWKWGRLVLAIVSSVLMLTQPVFNFLDEKGLENFRIYKMTPHRFEVHHIEMATGIDKLMGTMSVDGLFYSALAVLIGCVVCTVFYSSHRLRILFSSITAFLAGAYYLIMVFYAIRLSQTFFLVLYPNWIAILPTVILITMLSIRKETVRKLLDAKLKADEGL